MMNINHIWKLDIRNKMSLNINYNILFENKHTFKILVWTKHMCKHMYCIHISMYSFLYMNILQSYSSLFMYDYFMLNALILHYMYKTPLLSHFFMFFFVLDPC